MPVIFASLNVGLHAQQACGYNGARRFRAIARGVQQAFERVKVDAMGLVEVGDCVDGLPAQQAAELIDSIRAQMHRTDLVVHADATGHPYILLSKAESNVDVRDVRIVRGFVHQKERKALRATLVDADGGVDLWLVHLASSIEKRLTMRVREQMLDILATNTPTVVAGDINTPECILRQWMDDNDATNSLSLACSGASPTLHGDFTISNNVMMWQTEHQVGKSFQDDHLQPADCVSDAHDMVCVVLITVDTTDATALGDQPEGEPSPSDNPTTADAAEFGLSSRFREEAGRVVSQTRQALLEAEEEAVDWAAASEEEVAAARRGRSRSRSPNRWCPSPRSERHSQYPHHSPCCYHRHSGPEMSSEFLAAMQDMLWPMQVQERDRPADLLSFESPLSPTVRMAPREATVGVVSLILALRQVALDRREAQGRSSDTPLTYSEVGVVLEFWRGKFNEQTLTQEQAERDAMDGYSPADVRKRMRSRFTTYISRVLGNRKLGMALITVGFDVDLNTLANAYLQATSVGDGSSSADRDLRRRVLAMRAWYRWGRQLDKGLESGEVEWDSLRPIAQAAWEWHAKGWSAQASDSLTQEYGHGMLRTGRDGGSSLGQRASGSVVDRMRPKCL